MKWHPNLELYQVEEALRYQSCSNTELEESRKVKSEGFEVGGEKFSAFVKDNMFNKIFLLAPLVMGLLKLELDHVDELWSTKAFQTRSLRSVGKMNWKSLKLRVQNSGFCQKMMFVKKSFC